MTVKAKVIRIVLMGAIILLAFALQGCASQKPNSKDVEQKHLSEAGNGVQIDSSDDITNQSNYLVSKKEIWKYYSTKEMQIDGIEMLSDKESSIVNKYGTPERKYTQEGSYFGETDCLEYNGMTAYCAKSLLIEGNSSEDNPYIVCLETTKRENEGLDGIRVGDSIKNFKFNIDEKLKNKTEFVYAYDASGGQIENPSKDNIDYDNSFCMIEYSDKEGAGIVRFINNWNEFYFSYDNCKIFKMTVASIMP